MKLYLSSIEVPTPEDLAKLLGKPLKGATVAVIPNAQDYYSERARMYKNNEFEKVMKTLGLKVETVDLRDYKDSKTLKGKLKTFDLIWARGGNTFCLRYEMKRSGFGEAITDLLENGVVYGGNSAGALAAGLSIAGIESADIPDFAEKVINEGLSLVPYVVLPHIDNPEFADVLPVVRSLRKSNELIELKDNQAVVFEHDKHWIVEAVAK